MVDLFVYWRMIGYFVYYVIGLLIIVVVFLIFIFACTWGCVVVDCFLLVSCLFVFAGACY